MKRNYIISFSIACLGFTLSSKSMTEFEKGIQFDKHVLCNELSQLSKDKPLSPEVQVICNIKRGVIPSTQGDIKTNLY